MKKFQSLTLRGQKMRIVKDAIAQINTGIIIPGSGDYFSWEDSDKVFSNLENGVKELLLAGNRCRCCAKGALFASCVINVNKVTKQQRTDSQLLQKRKLSKWFDSLELDMIEAAFEEVVIYSNSNRLESNNCKTELGEKCVSFGKRYKSDKERLLAILNNILKYGKFNPSQKLTTK